MPDPCAGVPPNRWCPTLDRARDAALVADHLLFLTPSPIVVGRAPRLGFEPPARARYARSMGTLASPSIRNLLPVLLAATLVAPGTAAARSACTTVQGPAGPPFLDCALGQAHNILPPGADGLVNAA